MNSTLEAVQTHQTAQTGVETSVSTGVKTGGRWLEVVSHLHPKYGGLSSAVPALGQRMALNNGFDVSLAAFCAPGENFHPAAYDSPHLSYWPASRKPWLLDRFSSDRLNSDRHGLRRAFEEQLRNVDGVHIHGLWEQSTSVAADAARALKIPYILSAHGMLEPWALQNKRLKKLLYGHLVERANVAHASCLHALTRAEANHFISFGARSPIAIIPNGVDIAQGEDASLFLNRFPSAQGKRIVLFLGRLHPKKGLNLLLEAWSKIASQSPDAYLVLAGPDSEDTQANLEQIVSHHRLQASVLFTGMLRDSLKWSTLAAAEGFVLPSFSEGLSVGVLEAMGMGLPVIVTEPCNMSEVEEFQAGWQIQPDLAQLTRALTELLTNSPSTNSAIGARGAALIQSRYTWPIVAGQMAEVYRWLTGGPLPQTVELVFPGKS